MSKLPAEFPNAPLSLFYLLSQGQNGGDPTPDEAKAWSEEHEFGSGVITLLDPGQSWFDSMFPNAGPSEFMGAAVLERGSILMKKNPPTAIDPAADIAEALE